MKIRRWMLIGITVLVLISGLWGYYILNPEDRNVAKEPARYKVVALGLRDSMAAFSHINKYQDMVLEIEGTVTHVQEASVNLNRAVEVQLTRLPESAIQEGDKVVIKGRCIGYDELLNEVKIDQAVVIEISTTTINQ